MRTLPSIELKPDGSLFVSGSRWNDFAGGISLYDDLKKKRIAYDSPGEIVLSEKFEYEEGAIRWRVRAELEQGAAPRSITLFLKLPYPTESGKTRIWSCDFHDGTHALDELLSHSYRKNKWEQTHWSCRCEIEGSEYFRWDGIQHASIYIPERKTGIYIAEPGGYLGGILWTNFACDGLEIADSFQYLAPGHPVEQELLLIPVPGCWRPGLEWFHRRYIEYFRPPNKKAMTLRGSFGLTNPFTDDKTLDCMRAHNAAFTEIHNHFPCYGNFVPDEPEWTSVIAHDYPELPKNDEKVSQTKIRNLIKRLHRRKILALYYFQCTGDCFRPYAETHFPDSIALDRNGEKIAAWRECWLMNGSDWTSYGKHLDRQAERILEIYPEIDGIFMDQLCYPVEDIAHSDGITGVDNRPASNIDRSYYGRMERMAKRFHDAGKLIWGNGAFDLEVQKYVDGIMAEGSGGGSETLKYFCLDKPLLVHQYPDSTTKTELIFAYALRAGAWLYSIGASSRVPSPEIPPESEEIIQACSPLLEPLAERKFCFEPDPVLFPDGIDGDIFIGHEGRSRILTAVSMSGLYTGASKKELTFKLNIVPPPGPVQAMYRSTIHSEWIRARLDWPYVTLPEHCGMSVLEISCDQKWESE